MAQTTDYGTIFYVVVIVISVVFSIVKALLKGQQNTTGTILNPNKQASGTPSETKFVTLNDESIMVVDAQGNVINSPRLKSPAPPMKHNRQPHQVSVSRTKITGTMDAECKEDYQQSDNYIDFIRTQANSAIIMHEILGKPKALQ